MKIPSAFFLVLSLWAFPAPGQSREILELEVDGVINPAVLEYIEKGVREGERRHCEFVLIRLNTPGGLMETTRSLVQLFLNAPVPIVVWVYPRGAHAASAGMFITLAAHVAVMSPGTNIGAATPISSQGKDVENEGGKDLKRKVMEDTLAFARSIAEVRKRPQKWMEDAVSEAVSITNEEALKLGVIDLVASDLEELLEKLEGRVVEVKGETRTLKTREATITRYEMRLSEKIFHWLGHPNVAYLLMLLGILGIYFELSQPGGYIGGVIGSIALILAFMSLQILPFRIGGLILILLGIVLLILEVLYPTIGIFAVGGVISFLIGSLILFDTPAMDLRPHLGLILSATAVLGVSVLLVGYFVVRTHRRKSMSGQEGMMGELGVARTPLAPEGKVFCHGELWDARSWDGSTIAKGEKVKVVGVEGLILIVAPLQGQDTSNPSR